MEFRLLGPVAVHLRGQPRPLGGPRQRAVLAALLLHANEEVRTQQLLELVWSDLPSSAESNLRTYLARLRRILRIPGEPESRLRTLRGGHLVTVLPGELDVAAFTSLADRGEQAPDRSAACRHFARALEVWRGRALEDVSPGPLLAAEVARLEAHRERIREQYLRARLALGQHAELLPELHALLLRNPLWERLAGLLMLALHRSGQRTEALAVFRRTRSRLIDELGVEPGTELRELHQRLLAGDDPVDPAVPVPRPTADARSPAALARITGTAGLRGIGLRPPTGLPPASRPAPERAAGPPAQLPVDVPVFCGRAAEIAALLDGVPPAGGSAPDRRPIIAVDGMAGVGKTTLVVHAAHRLAPDYPDGQLFLDLHGHTHGVEPLDPHEALDRMLRALGVPSRDIPPATEDRAALHRSLLAHRRMLVVLDNAHSEAQVRPLLPGAGRSRALITSRRRLTGLHQAHPLSLDVLPPHQAVDVFRRISSPRPLPDGAEALLGEVVELCGRLPLALRIAAVRFRDRPSWQLAHLHERLSDQQRRLTELDAGEHGVAATFALSLAELEPDKRWLLVSLGLHPGTTVEVGAAAALAGLSVPVADRLLEELVDAHLLRQTAPGRYELHNLMRAFISGLAHDADPAEVRAAVRRLLDHHLHTAEAVDHLIQPARPREALAPPDPVVEPRGFSSLTEALAWCDRHRSDFVGLARLAAEHGLLTHAWQLPTRLEGYFDLRQHWAEGIAAYEVGLAAARRLGDRPAESELLMGLAFGWTQLREDSRAISCYTSAISVSREIGNGYAEGVSAIGLAEVHRSLGRFGEAVRFHRQALAVYRRLDDTYASCVSLDYLGSTYRDQGRFEEALECYRLAHEDSERIGNRYSAGRHLINLSQTHQALGQHGRASWTGERALALCGKVGDRDGEACALTTLGLVRAELGDTDRARGHLAAAHRVLDELGDERAADVRAYLDELPAAPASEVDPCLRR
ncbi:AfsR/SARP family transcriptional regulator [Saccharopolyspora cebuensis]|uniref:BTAD domain-containing putative transcriptional regulator n=1 Tax=Saccharopolyspora cebuensis TaxID=418759 RepID=A0ABV4CIZ5_9PSEU